MNIKSNIVYAIEKVLGQKVYKWRKEWFDEECKDKINVKNQVRNNWIQKGGEQKFNAYEKEKQEACRKKKQWITKRMKGK